ncbi:hypothetical protein HY570_02115 [Candidatus Micrarchaeota archaeon]|nr:hypothetical protein [Candidatus Micrarchaeota archaeon]
MIRASAIQNIPNVIYESFKLVFEKKKYYLLAGVASIITLLVYVGLPIYSIPGNNLEIFLATSNAYGLIFMFLLSILIGILISMQVYAFKRNLGGKTKEITTGFTAFFSSIIGAIFTGATCALCVGSLFSFLGAAGIIFLLEHRIEISILSFFLILSSLYLTSRRIYNCDSCRIKTA